ncbi:MAG TPA: LTA synthase family protein [Gammaproteobacteria bacterium]
MGFEMKRRVLSTGILLLIVTCMGVNAFLKVDELQLKKSYISLNVLRELGMVAYVVREIDAFIESQILLRSLDEVPTDPIRQFLDSNAAQPEARSFSSPQNVVFLQLESIEANALNAQLDGKYVMDFMRKLSGEALYFDNVIDQTTVGRTSDAEFLVLTSQVPLRDAPVYTSHDLSFIPSLPKTMDAAGYRTISLHGFRSDFWNRRANHRNLGFEESYFLEDMQTEEMLGWGVSDFATVDRSLDLLATAEEPVFLFTVLLSSHHPYNYVRQEFQLEDRGIVHDYLYSLSYVDDAVERFFAGLDARGLRENTIVFVYGDHDAGLDNRLVDHADITVDSPNDRVQEVLLMIDGLERSGRESRPMGLQDLAPTLLTELGIPVPQIFVGSHFSVEHEVLLPNNRMIRGLSKEGLVVVPSPVDFRHMTLLALYRPDYIKGGAK